jgi:hypothetical protein
VQLHKPTRRAWWRAFVALFVIAVVVGPSVASDAAGRSDPSAERAKVRAQKAKVATQVNALKATDAQVDRALADLQANVNGQQQRANEAQRAANEAAAAADEARAAVTAKQAEIDALKSQVREFAVQAFVHPPGDDALAAMDTDDPGQAAERRALLELQSTNDADLHDQLSAPQEDHPFQKQVPEDASDRASQKQAEVQSRLDDLRSARDQQAAYADQVQDRLDHALAEADSLASLDASLSAQIRQQEEARATRAGSGTGRSSGGSRIGNVDTARASCPGGGGITVAASIVENLQRLLNAASSDGVQLCGGGYRSSEAQIQTRKANGCPDIYKSPASACHPPTAKPGTSMHERGLAVDFTCNGGGVISSRSSSCFQWMSAHAGSYGFHNLPSEPWHWSTNGD